jgi:hypothetical protein
MTDSARLQSAAFLRSLAEMADGSLAARIRLEQAARVITTARRASVLAAAGVLRLPNLPDAAVQAVTEITRHWDAAAVTALEYAETLPEAAIERLLRNAPAWAAAFQPGTPTRLAA